MPARRNVDTWNSRGGRIGSAARRSTKMAPTRLATLSRLSPTVQPEAQSNSMPASDSISSREVADVVINVAPSQSIFAATCKAGTLSVRCRTTAAIAAIGMPT